MMEFMNNLYNMIMDIVTNSVFWGPILACLLIFVESLIIAYGYVIGFIISYILTCLGCFFMFYLCRTVLKNIFSKKVRKIEKFDILMKKIDKISLSNLVLLIAIPFTPAFLINIASALSEIKFKKFAVAVLIGKVSLVFFWGFIGTSLIESLKNPKILLIIIQKKY